MLGSQQAKIIGILRIEFEKDPNKFFTVKEIHQLLNKSNKRNNKVAYTTVSTILKRLSEQDKIIRTEEYNKHFFQYKDIQGQISEKIFSMFINAFGTSGLANLLEKGKNLTKDDIKDLTESLDN